MPNADRRCACWKGPPLCGSGKRRLKFYGRTRCDEHYNGLALDESEGRSHAAAMGDAGRPVPQNHGVMVGAGASIAECGTIF